MTTPAKFTPLFYLQRGSTFDFIYFGGYDYKVVTIENYFGFSDMLQYSPALPVTGSIYDKCAELNEPIKQSEKDAIALREEFRKEHDDSYVSIFIQSNGMRTLQWTDDIIPEDLKAKFPDITTY